MNKQYKELLLKYLCCSLPYGVKVKIKYYDDTWKLHAIYTNGVGYATRDIGYPIETFFEDCTPYLFPLSSMTEEQWNNAPSVNLTNFTFESLKCGCFTLASYTCDNNLHDLIAFVNWLIKNHFDVNNLIPMGLAIDATNLNIY